LPEKKLKVLLIEDNPGDARLVKEMLAQGRSAAFELESCERLQAGMELLENKGFDVVLTDLNLPDSGGLDTLRRLLSEDFEPPIIVLTGMDDDEAGLKAVEEGAQDYLPKGKVDAGLLERSIRYAIERKRAKEELRRSEEYHRALIENSKDLIIVLDREGSIIYVSPFVDNVLGFKPEEAVGRKIFDFIHPDDRRYAMDVFENASRVPGKPYNIECRVVHRNGSWRYIESIGVNHLDDPDIGGFVINSRHVTERKRLEEQLRNLSLTDELTGLNNRRGFQALAEQYAKIAKRQRRSYCVLFCDLDGLKQINDTLGHPAGNQALEEVADVLRETFRESDIAARFGGDEFVVLVADASPAEMDILLDRLEGKIDERNATGKLPFTLSVSYGLSYFNPSQPESLERIISSADAVMYENKRAK
jgi:two-component system cell cycle response regulator